MTELLPCPFCGGTDFKFKRMKLGYTNWNFLSCKNCKCRVQHFKKEFLVEVWNKRTLPENHYLLKIDPEVLKDWNEPIDD